MVAECESSSTTPPTKENGAHKRHCRRYRKIGTELSLEAIHATPPSNQTACRKLRTLAVSTGLQHTKSTPLPSRKPPKNSCRSEPTRHTGDHHGRSSTAQLHRAPQEQITAPPHLHHTYGLQAAPSQAITRTTSSRSAAKQTTSARIDRGPLGPDRAQIGPPHSSHPQSPRPPQATSAASPIVAASQATCRILF
jgi:hypothetical protein